MQRQKIAIFTEGLTETLLITEILYHLAKRENIFIESKWAWGGTAKRPRQFYSFASQKDNPDANEQFYALIYQSGGDSRVVSDVREQYQRLVDENFDLIVAVRDVKPDLTKNDIEKFRTNFASQVRQDPIAPILVLATMETEAWFAAEHSHFPRVHPSLTHQSIKNLTGIDLLATDFELIEEPFEFIRDIYQSVNVDYSKSKADIQQALSFLDFEIVCLELSNRVPSIDPLIATLTSFLKR